MSPATRTVLRAALFLAAVPFIYPLVAPAAAQATSSLPAPTLPSDTLEANYGPRSEVAPMPELAPSLPSDTIDIGAPLEGYDPAVSDSLNPGPAPDDSTADQPVPAPY